MFDANPVFLTTQLLAFNTRMTQYLYFCTVDMQKMYPVKTKKIFWEIFARTYHPKVFADRYQHAHTHWCVCMCLTWKAPNQCAAVQKCVCE